MGFSISPENISEILIAIALNLEALGSIIILTVLRLPIHEHGMFSILFVSSLIPFSSVLLFSVYQSFSSLVTFISKYFMLFDAIVN